MTQVADPQRNGPHLKGPRPEGPKLNGARLNGTHQPAGPGVVAALHRQSDRWRVLILNARDGLSLLHATSVDADAQVAPLLAQYQVEHVVRVAPSRQTVARCVPVPAGEPTDLAPALALLAEAQLPESVAPHRRAAGIIPESEGPGRSAILSGWQGESPGDVPESDVEESWITPAAALAILRGGLGDAAVYADPDEGAISILVFGGKSMARVLVEDAPTPLAFARSVNAVVSETCAAAGAPAPATPLGQSGIVLAIDPGVIPAIRADVRGVPDQRSWFEQYGIALGGALAGASTDPLIRPLASMRSTAPVRRESPPERAVNWLARRRNAWILIAASIALIFLAPLAIAWAKLAILDSKAVGLGDRNRERTEVNRRAALYQQLEKSRWPMAKLLGDISAAIPMGVTTESIRIGSDQGLAIQGTAESADLVNTMQANLNATKLLSNVKFNRQESVGSGVEFDMTAEVINPYTKAAGVEDFATKTLAQRLYGDEAVNTTMPKNVTSAREAAATREPRTVSRSSDRPERTERSGGGGGGGDRGERGGGERGGGERGGERGNDRGSRTSEAPSRPTAAAAGEPPPALTDDQIKKMDKAAAMKEWASRKAFLPKADAATKPRIEEEIQKLFDHFKSGGAAK